MRKALRRSWRRKGTNSSEMPPWERQGEPVETVRVNNLRDRQARSNKQQLGVGEAAGQPSPGTH